MQTTPFTCWQEDEAWLGYLDKFPNYCARGESLEDLKGHLVDLYRALASGKSAGRHGELELA